jgi:hypothetical protein
LTVSRRAASPKRKVSRRLSRSCCRPGSIAHPTCRTCRGSSTLAHNDEQCQILESFSQASEIAELRTAFAATLKDLGFLADAENMQVSLTPLPGDKLQAIIENAFAYSPAIVAKAQALISAGQDR